jgi:diguanylate cyclase (GGDEF)-like protein
MLNFNNATESIQNRLYEDAQNTASSLSLSLGTAADDLTTMQTMINANFDSGNYNFISLVDMDGNVLYKREKEILDNDNVPNWFKKLVDIPSPIASANVSSGWTPVGILNVQSDNEYGYTQLYNIFIGLLVSFGIIFFISLILLYLLLAAVLRPLKDIQKQAEAVAKNEFIIVEKIPYTKEFREVVKAMNVMVKKVKSMFEKANEELKIMKEKEYTDSVTKLKNRKFFINKLPEYLKIDAKYKFGTNVMIALNGVIEANKEIGYKKVDELFVKIADIFRDAVKENEDAIIARMNGTEFSILLPGYDVEKSFEIFKEVQEKVTQTIKDYGLNIDETYIDIGLYEYSNKESISELLSSSDNALAKAKLQNSHIYFESTDKNDEVMGKDEWREIIKSAIANDGIELMVYGVMDTKTKKIVHEALSIALKTEDKYFTYGQFVASAVAIGLVDDIYRKVIELLLSKYNSIFENKVCSLRLSNEFLNDKDTYEFIKTHFEKYSKNLKFKLIIEIPDKFISQHKENAILYKQLFDKHNVEMGIFEFIGESDDYYYLQEYKPTYIKSEKEYFLTQDTHNLNALKLLTESIDIDLIASGVMDKDSLERLQELGIYIVQGRVVELI